MEKNRYDYTVLSNVSEEAFDALFGRWQRSLEVFIDQVRNLPDSFFDDYEFIYRPHPGSTIEFSLGNKARIIFDGPISDWLSNVDVFCTWQSTSAFEAEIAGLPVFFHECIPIPAIERMPGVSDYKTIHDLEEITTDSIKECLCRQMNSPIFQKYIGDCDEAAVERHVHAIEEVGLVTDRLAVVPYSRWWLAKMYLSEIVIKILKGAGLIRRLKWPHTASMMYDDIPFGDPSCADLHH